MHSELGGAVDKSSEFDTNKETVASKIGTSCMVIMNTHWKAWCIPKFSIRDCSP